MAYYIHPGTGQVSQFTVGPAVRGMRDPIRLSDGRVIDGQASHMFATDPETNPLLRRREDGRWEYDPERRFDPRTTIIL